MQQHTYKMVRLTPSPHLYNCLNPATSYCVLHWPPHMSSDGYTGFNDEQETVLLTASSVARIHREGGTVLRSARGGFDAKRITAFLISRGITQLYVLGELCLFPSLRVSFITVTVCLYCLTSLRIDIHNGC